MINTSLIEQLLGDSFENSTSASFKVSAIIISIAIMLFAGFLLTRVTKKLKLPNVTAYIIVGVLLGPLCALIFGSAVIPSEVVSGMEFLASIAVAFISFSAGQFFKLDNLKQAGVKVIIIAIFETLISFALVFAVSLLVLGTNYLSFCLVLASLASATAPAAILTIIRQTNSKGEYVNNLLEVIALDTMFTLLLFSITSTICIGVYNGSSFSFWSVAKPILLNLLCLAIGVGFGFLLKIFLPKSRTTDNRLIIAIGLLFLFCGICSILNQSPLLGCMAIGMVYTNISGDEKLFNQLNYFAPPIMLLFFVRSGLNFKLDSFAGASPFAGIPLVVISLIFFVTRFIGKMGGAFVGGVVSKSDKRIRNYTGLGLIPQASVAISLAAMGSQIFRDAGQVELGVSLETIIIAASIMFEIVGPGCGKLGLYLSKSYSNDLEDITEVINAQNKNDVEVLIDRINQIKETIKPITIEEEYEKGFDEAAEEYENDVLFTGRRRFINRK